MVSTTNEQHPHPAISSTQADEPDTTPNAQRRNRLRAGLRRISVDLSAVVDPRSKAGAR